MPKDLIKISKTISRALRHAPDSYNIKLDHQGRVSISSLVESISRELGIKIDLQDIHDILANSDKKRLEIKKNKIRAIYGHSIENKIKHKKIIPPQILYHGTTAYGYKKIMKSGIQKMSRQYVHLSTDIKSAKEVALRRTKNPIILKIRALDAHNKGINFYKASGKIVLSDFIPKKFVSY